MQNPTPFIGRDNELKELRRRLNAALNYNGSFILIQGEIGVGKTRLLNQFVDEIKMQGCHILNSRAVKDELRPFSPFIQMIEDFLYNLEHCGSWLTKFMDQEIAHYLIHLMPKLEDVYPLEVRHWEYPVDNVPFVYSFQRFFENLSKSKPLVLILDDIQWISGVSIELLKYLVRRMIDQPILFVATARVHKDNPLLIQAISEFNAERLVFTIDLENLSQNETEKLLKMKFKSEPPSHFVHWLFRITEGNPLFVEEIINTLVRQNIIRYEADKKKYIIEEDYENFLMSATLESVISYHLGKLNAPELRLLENAAVIGERFTLQILRKLLSSIPKKQFLRSYNMLVALGLINDSEDTKQFSHPLIRELLYHKIEIHKRRKLHRRLANILKKIQAGNEEIVFHMTEDLSPAEETKGLACSLFDISKDLLGNCNYHLAWKYLKIAHRIASKTSILDNNSMRIKAELNYLSWIMGKNVLSFEEALQFAEELANSNLKKEAALHYRMLFHDALVTQNLKTAEKYLEKGISLVKKDDAFYWTLMVEHCLLQRRKGLLKESAEEAQKLSTEIPSDQAPEALYKVLHNLGMVAFLRGDLESAHQLVEQALKTTEQYHLLSHICDSYMNLGLVEMTMGRLDSALAKLNDSMHKAELLQRVPAIAINLIYIGYCYLYMGKYERAIAFFDKAGEKAMTLHNQRIRSTSQLGRARVFVESGDIEKAESIAKEMSEYEMEKGVYCELMLVKSLIHLAKGELNLAEEFADTSFEYSKKMHSELHSANALSKKARVLLQKRNRDEAMKYFENTRNKLSSMGAMCILSDLLINFGLTMGGVQGETIFTDGLKMLFEMRAFAKIDVLCKRMKKKGFSNAFKLIRERMRNVEANKIDIFTFGGLSVKKPGEFNVVSKKEWHSRKSQELLGLILVQSGLSGVTREKLSTYLWPEAIKEKSQANFRVALTHLNRILGNKVILRRGQFLTFNRDFVDADFWTFELLVKEWQSFKQCGKLHPAEERARKAITLYKGEFLPEFYTQPIIDRQRDLKQKMRNLLVWLANRCMERIELQEAVFFARRLLTFDINDEQANQIIMQGLHDQGDRIGAIRQFERLKKNLKEELDTEPSPETINIYKRITGAN
jgi:two-component SAPR family response regulator/Tfp pilus assembly protein PilF